MAPDPDPSSAQLAELAEKLAPGFSGKHVAGIENVSHQEAVGLRFTLADVTVQYTQRHNDTDHHHQATQTAAQYDSPNHRFPEFSLQPSSKMMDMLVRMSGFQDIDFASHPAFSKAYLLMGTSTPAIRRLFEHAPLLDLLGRRAGLSIHAQLSGLVIHRWELRCDEAQRKAFGAESAIIFKLFEDAATAALHKPAPKEDAEAYFASLPSPVGERLRKKAVRRADLKAFLAQPVPRAPSRNIVSAAAGAGASFLHLIGAVFTVVGGFFTAMYRSGENIMGLIFPLLFALGGVAAIAYGVLLAMRARRMLRHGALAQARIEGLEPTGNSTNGVADYRLRVRFQAGAEGVEADCTASGHGALRARLLKADGKPATVLYDPANPRQVLFTDGLLTLSPEIES